MNFDGKMLQRYVVEYGEQIKESIIAEIKRNNWIRTGTLLASVEPTVKVFADKILLDINIADYYANLKTGRKAKDIEAKRVAMKAGAKPVSTRAFKSGAPVKNIEKQNNFVGDIIRKKLPMIDKDLTNKLDKDIQKMFDKEIKTII
jgi:hypothetical protein